MKESSFYIWASHRRRLIDELQEKYKDLYKGVVLDIGGRDRGLFKKPKSKVEKWIFADINEQNKPDIVLDVTNMMQIDSESIDVINAIELFEHVHDIKKGLKECHRVLKKKGLILISIPFLAQIHADPYDYQRWTYTKWQKVLKKIGFEVIKFHIMGKYFSHLSETIKDLLKAIERRPSRIGTLFLKLTHPFFNWLILFDNKEFVQNDPVLNNYHTGYFILSRKS
ncbi:MAG: methyltransferase domain-containing protein [Promethearchaeota archaeon]